MPPSIQEPLHTEPQIRLNVLADAASSICRAGAEYSQGTEHDQPPEPLPNDSFSTASSDAARPQVYEDSGVQKYVYADPESPRSIVASSQRDETPNGNISPALCDDGQPTTMSGTCEDAPPTEILNRLRVREQSFQNNAVAQSNRNRSMRTKRPRVGTMKECR